jgi:hypothetical protein
MLCVCLFVEILAQHPSALLPPLPIAIAAAATAISAPL